MYYGPARLLGNIFLSIKLFIYINHQAGMHDVQ